MDSAKSCVEVGDDGKGDLHAAGTARKFFVPEAFDFHVSRRFTVELFGEAVVQIKHIGGNVGGGLIAFRLKLRDPFGDLGRGATAAGAPNQAQSRRVPSRRPRRPRAGAQPGVEECVLAAGGPLLAGDRESHPAGDGPQLQRPRLGGRGGHLDPLTIGPPVPVAGCAPGQRTRLRLTPCRQRSRPAHG